MGWITRSRRRPGWLAMLLHPDHVELVHVQRGADGTPALLMCDSYRKAESDAATLSRLSKELRLDRYRCTTLLGPSAYQLHHVEAPNVPPAELKQAVRWRVKDLIDFPVETARVEVLEIPVDNDAAVPERAVYAVVAELSTIERCVEPFNAARVPLESVDIPEIAQRNVAALFEPEAGGVVMLAFYRNDALLTFTRGGELYSSRRIDVSLPQIVQADEARRGAYFERVALELQRSIDHLGRQYHYVPQAKVLLGPIPHELRLEEYLASIVSVPVETVDLAAVMDVAGVPDLKQVEAQGPYLQAIGAALRDEAAPA